MNSWILGVMAGAVLILSAPSALRSESAGSVQDAKQSEPAAAPTTLPQSWHGVWSGQLTVYPVTGQPFERFMEIQIAPVPGRQAVTWKVISTFRDKKTVRNYELVSDPKKPGLFQIDEKNGILLDAKLMGKTLYIYFKDNEMLTNIKYEHCGDHLFMEMASVTLNEPRVFKGQGIEIHSYELKSVQVGELKKKTGQ